MVDTARAFWIEAPLRGAIREERLPDAGPGFLRVRTLYSAVSRGTESLVWQGRVPASEHERMRCPHQLGQFPFPVKYGYVNVGRVVAGAENWRGRLVFSLHPHQSTFVIHEDEVVPLPAELPPERAVLGANMETALNALWDARPQIGDRITIVGAGVVGCSCAFLASKVSAADVELVDVVPERAAIAARLGVGFSRPEHASPERDLVFHASGSEAGLALALAVCGKEGTVIELSWYGDRPVTLALGGFFHAGRLTLRASQVGTVSPAARARFTHAKRLALALDLCADEVLDALIDGEHDFMELPSLLAKLADPAQPTLCRRIRYRDED